MFIATRSRDPMISLPRSLLPLTLALAAANGHAAIPASERAVLLALYAQAGGSGWTGAAAAKTGGEVRGLARER